VKKRNIWLVKGLLAAVFIAGVILLWKYVVTREQVIEVVEYVRSFGAWTAIVYFLLYTMLVTLSFPSTILNITSGILLSFSIALGVSALAALSGACITFLFARYWMKDSIKKKLEHYDSSKQVLELAEDGQWRFVILLRLNPFIPAVLKNYGFGITNISFKQYVWSSFIGQLPLVTLYTYLGWVGGNSMLNSDSHPPTYQWAILAGGAVVSIIMTIVAYRHTKKRSNANTQPA
jgi:uncharacterized membrane protein YdjX (TVP38/TMEM64 family)